MLKWTERKSSNPQEISKVNVEAQGPTILDEEGIFQSDQTVSDVVI